LRSGVQICLNWLNISYLRQHGTTVPEIFQDIIDPEKLKQFLLIRWILRISLWLPLSQPRTVPGYFALWILALAGKDHQPVALRTDREWFDFLCRSLDGRQLASHSFGLYEAFVMRSVMGLMS